MDFLMALVIATFIVTAAYVGFHASQEDPKAEAHDIPHAEMHDTPVQQYAVPISHHNMTFMTV